MQAYAKLENNDDPIVLAILQGRNGPTTVVIVDIRLSVVSLHARRGLTSLAGMPGDLNSRAPATLNGSPGLTVCNNI